MAFNHAREPVDPTAVRRRRERGNRLSKTRMISEKTRPRTRLLRGALAALIGASILLGPGCMSVYHTVGAGATGGEVVSESQWYALWGFLPIGGAPDSRTLAGDQVNYTVYDGFTTWDVVLNFFTSWLGFYRASLIVEF